MNWKKQLVPAIALLLAVAGCSRNPEYDPPQGIEGPWEGTAIAVHPGPVDEPLTDTATIYFNFEKGQFTYSGRVNPSDSLIIQHGSYTDKGDTLWLIPDVNILTYHPLYLYGAYKVELDGLSLRLLQDNHQPDFSDYHDINLERVLPMPD